MASLLKGVSLIQPSGEPFKGSLEGEWRKVEKRVMVAHFVPPRQASDALLLGQLVVRGCKKMIEAAGQRVFFLPLFSFSAVLLARPFRPS